MIFIKVYCSHILFVMMIEICHTKCLWRFEGFKVDINWFKHWILCTLNWEHHNVWSCCCSPSTYGYPYCTGSDIIIWISDTRQTSLLLPLFLVFHLPCFKTDPYGNRTHDYSHTKWASYHMTTEEAPCPSAFHYG